MIANDCFDSNQFFPHGEHLPSTYPVYNFVIVLSTWCVLRVHSIPMILLYWINVDQFIMHEMILMITFRSFDLYARDVTNVAGQSSAVKNSWEKWDEELKFSRWERAEKPVCLQALFGIWTVSTEMYSLKTRIMNEMKIFSYY